MDPALNFVFVTVSIGYDASATSIVLATGHGAFLPDPAIDGEFNLVWYDSTLYPNPADGRDITTEIVRVTARSTDTLTVIRNQESSGASVKNTTNSTFKMYLGVTAKTITDISYEIDTDIATHAALTSTHGVTTIAGLDEAQTFTNKSISDTLNIDDITELTAGAGVSFEAGRCVIDGYRLYNGYYNNHVASIDFNYTGYNNGFTAFRDLNVYDGQGVKVIFVDGSEKTTTFSGDINGTEISQEASFTLTANLFNMMTDPRLLINMTDDPTGTIHDYSSNGHDGTTIGSMTSGDQRYKGLGYVYDLDGVDDGIDFGDHDDFSFGDGANDTSFTICAFIEIVNGYHQSLISKWDGVVQREWQIFVTNSRNTIFYIADESAGVYHYVTASSVAAGYHWVVATYDGRGGADADDGMNMYIDGVLTNNVKSGNTPTYTAMENLTTNLLIGIRPDGVNYEFPFQRDMGITVLDGAEWSAADVWKSYLLIKGTYNL